MSDQQLKTIQQYYSEAETIEDTVEKALKVIENETGLLPREVVYADSFCCDEVNTIQFSKNEMAGPFKLGGLGGYPFAGVTGMNAFTAHIPDSGAALIFYGPHIGMTKEGKIGKVLRIGQNHHTRCCGSVSGALDKLLQNKIQKDDTGEEDYQQQVIEQILLKEEKRIKASDQQIMEATEVIYEEIDQQIDRLISAADFNCSTLIKAGGIFINSDREMQAYWAERRFEIVDLESEQITL